MSPAAVAPPRVSVITPVFDAAGTLAATVASVQTQTVDDWEMLLVDDGSRDGSLALAQALAAREPRLRVLALPGNQGPAAARNAGIRAARGRFIACLDADDLWYPGKLERQLAVLEAGVPLVFSAYRRVDAAGRPLGVVRAPARPTYRDALKGNAIGCSTAVYDSAAFGKAEMPPLRRRQDYGLWLTLLREGRPARGLSEVLVDYRVRPGSLSSDRLAALAATWRVYREVARLGPVRAAYYMVHNVARAAAKRL